MNDGLLGGFDLNTLTSLGAGLPFIITWLRLMVAFFFGGI